MAATSELLVALVTAVNAGAAAEVVRRLSSAVRHRKASDRQRRKVELEIERVVADRADYHSAVTEIIRILNKGDADINDAVIVLGDQVLIKDSAAGTPKVVLRNVSADQREKISRNQAPMTDAALFHAWLDDTRQPEGST